jgi:hypothetical protein
MYLPALKALLDADIDLLVDNLKVVLIDSADYTFSNTHQFLSDVPVAARVATSGNLASKTTTDGIFDAADITLSAVTGDPIEALIIYQDTGVAATSRLIVYLDGLAFTPSGIDLTIQWDNGANKIFKINP